LTYDNNGNLTSTVDSSGTTLYTWNARNQLTSLSGPGVSASFVYDGLGRREKKTINGALTEYLHDGFNPVQETSGAAVLANILSGLGIDEYFTRTDIGVGITSTLLSDALGSTVAMADSSGSIQTEYTYEPFGKTTLTGSSNSTPFQFTARENDWTGLYYYRARYYHPTFQRFISEDPIEFFGGDFNLYAYVWNSPLDLIDPSGLAITMPWPRGCQPNPPANPGSKSSPERDSWGNPFLDFLRDIYCDPNNLIPMPAIVTGPTPGMIRAFEKQLARDGLKSLEKSLRSFEKNLAEHLQKIAEATPRGGPTSSLETEVRNFQAQIEAIRQVLRR
jgi:RHS repeat-associated protein